jgi:hypothetical protein
LETELLPLCTTLRHVFDRLGTAVPPRRFTQPECLAALQNAPQFLQLNARSHALLKKVLTGENEPRARRSAGGRVVDARSALMFLAARSEWFWRGIFGRTR